MGKYFLLSLCKLQDHQGLSLDLCRHKSEETKGTCQLALEGIASIESHPCWVPPSPASDAPLVLSPFCPPISGPEALGRRKVQIVTANFAFGLLELVAAHKFGSLEK